MSETSRTPGRRELGPGPRTRVRRLAERAQYDRTTIHDILDQGLVCHLGFIDGNRPVVIPTTYARDGGVLYLHGAASNHALRTAVEGAEACVTVTLVDGLVLSRSAFHHSLNYRSVVAFGVAREVCDLDEKRRALLAVVEHVVPGRARDARAPSDSELRATRVIRIEIEEASAKIRSGGPKEEPEDLALDIWAGHVPLELVAGAPVGDDQAPPSTAVPRYLTNYRRPEGIVLANPKRDDGQGET